MEEPILFSIEVSPNVVALGDEVLFTVEIANNGDDDLKDLVYRDELETALLFSGKENPDVAFDEASRAVLANIGVIPAGQRLSFSYSARLTNTLQDRPRGELWIHSAQLTDQDGTLDLKASADIWIGAPQTKPQSHISHVPPAGGWADLGPASLNLDPKSLGKDVFAVLTPIEKPTTGPDFQFSIELSSVPALASGDFEGASEQQVKVEDELLGNLSSPATLQISFDSVADLTQLPPDKSPYVATYDAQADVWVKVPLIDVDHTANSVRVKAVHFSTWGAGLGYSLPQNGANVLLFDEPYTSLFTGRSRFSYPIWTPPGRAGMAPSIALSYTSGTVDGVLGDVQAPWVGVGWNIDGVEIVRKILTDENGYGYENAFTLSFNGVKYELIEDSQDPGRFHTKEASFLYIRRHNPALGNAADVSNVTKEWWEIAATDGTRYRLGWDTDSEQLALMDGYSCTVGSPCTTPNGAYASLGYAGEGVDVVALRWRVDRVMDTHDNFIDYSYHEEEKDVGSITFDRASYLEAAQYTGHLDSQGEVDRQPGYTVQFNLADRSGDNPAQDLEIWDNYDDKLLDSIQICYGTCATGTVVRTYDLGYEVRSVPSVDGTLTLTSITASGGGFSDSGQSITSAAAPTVRFSYGDRSNIDEDCANCEKWPYPRLDKVENGYSGKIEYSYEHDNRGEGYWYNWRVTEVEVHDGMSISGIRGYAYQSPVYEGIGEDPSAGALIGYTYVTETTYEFNGTTKILDVRHHFGTEEPEIARTYSTEWKNSGGTVLRKVSKNWQTDNSWVPDGVNFVYLKQESRYERSGSSLTLLSKSLYTRDPATGNLTEAREYMGMRFYRFLQYEYSINNDPSVWILGLISRATIRNSSYTLLSDARYFYDGGTAPPTAGDLTLVQTLRNGSSSTVDVKTIYDAYGNVTETRAYTYYGSPGVEPSADYQATQIAYDATLYTYPVTVTNALNESTSTDFFFTLGLPWKVEDPNSDITETSYDGLGRMTNSIAPGFSVPTTKLTYPVPDGGGEIDAPYSIKLEIRDTLGPSSPTYRPAWAIYDGLGRIHQNQVSDADSGKLLVTDAAYNAQGLTERGGLPRMVSGSGGAYYPPNWTTLDHTLYDYDALGRVIEVEQPGDRITQYLYDGLTTTAIDPNGHKISREADRFGRTIKVREYTGSDPSWSLYATTTYAYDTLDRLIQVKDTHGNITQMSYDWLGRKISMTDPDMGTWSYEYKPTGELAYQTDARGQDLSFTYDDLNRLTKKRDEDAQSDLATYTYGSTSGTFGRRTVMSDQTGTTTWSYSNHGRTVTETRDITGANDDFASTTVSDWLGRVDTITYPDNEVVSYDYDALGRTDGLSGSVAGNLVELAYNALGQITTTSLGNGVLVQNCYEDETHRLEARRAYPGAVESCNTEEPADALLNFTYTYDPVGNITALQDFVKGEAFEFTYDSLDRLLVAEGVSPTAFAYRHAYKYDPVGNITQVETWGGARAEVGSYEEDYFGFWFVGDWDIVFDAGASSGAYAESDQTGALARIAFTGAGLIYIRPVGPDQGIADLYLDGLYLAEVDNYAATAAQQQEVMFSAESGDHLLEIRVSGRKNAQSSGTEVGLDAVEILAGEPTPTPTFTPTVTLTPSTTPSPTSTSPPTSTPTPEFTPTPTVSPSESVIGEIGQITDALTEEEQTVVLSRSYTNPVVFAQPLSFASGDTAAVRISEVQSDRFTLFVHEAPNMDGSHSAESVSYMVLEAGSWQLSDGTLLEVGEVTTSSTVGANITNEWQSVNFNKGFNTTPVVLSQIQTENDANWAKTRQRNVTSSGFKVALEEEEAALEPHGSETIGWLAINKGSGMWSGHPYEASTTTDSVTHAWYDLSFDQNFSSSPRFVASMVSHDGGDNAYLRYQNLTSSGLDIKVEEDTTYDSETNHTSETVGFLAVEGSGALTGRSSIVAEAGTYEETDSVFLYSKTWDDHADASYSGGHAYIADSLGENVTFAYSGNKFTIYRYIGPDRGILEVCIDGTDPENCSDLDNYAETGAFQQPASYEEPSGQHTVTLRYSGRKDPDSLGYLVSLDKVVVEASAPSPTPTATATPTNTWTPTATPSSTGIQVGSIVTTHVEKSSSVDFSHTVEEGESRVLVVTFVYRRNSGQSVWGVSYDGTSMTKLASRGDPGANEAIAHMWYMIDPPVGSHTVHIGLNSAWVVAGAYTLYGVDLSDPVVDYTTRSGEGPVSVTLDSDVDDMGLDIIASNHGGYLDPGEGQIERWDQNKSGSSWSLHGSSSTESATGSQITMSYELGSSRQRGYVAAVFRAWQPPTATTTPTPTATPTPLYWPTPITQTPEAAGTFENTHSAWYYIGDWEEVSDGSDSGGSRHVAQIPWSGAQLTFTGNGFDYYYHSLPSYGIAEIYVDGVKKASVDQYHESGQAQQSLHVTLQTGDHVLEIRRTERKNADSSGFAISLDKVAVQAAPTPTATLTPTVTLTPTPTSTASPTPTYQWITTGSTVSSYVECDNSIDFNHTVEEGVDRLLLVSFVIRRDNNQDLWGVSYEGENMTLVASRGDPSADEAIAHLWYLANPPVGEGQVHIGLDSACVVAGAYTLYGVDLLDPVVDFGTESGTGGPVSDTLNASPGDMGVDVAGIDEATGLTPGEGQTEQWDEAKTGSGWGMRGASSTEGSTGSQVTMSYDFGAYRDFAYVAAVFRARQAPYPTLTPTQSPTPTPTGTPQQGWERASYTYSSTHPHAVTSVERMAGTDTFGYDAAGNMTSRLESSVNWTQTFNAEGRLSQVSDGSDTWTFTHDGDGVRLKQANPDGTTTLFLGGGLYEVTIAGDGSTSSVKRYYSVAGQRVLRDGEGLHYLLTDHLGSIVGVLDGSGNLESEQRYLPYGGPRYSPDIGETDFAFTGQRSLKDVGLMDYNARWYSVSLGRFISPDVITPWPTNPQSFNHFTYTLGNPLKFSDPTGFYEFEDDPTHPSWPKKEKKRYDIDFEKETYYATNRNIPVDVDIPVPNPKPIDDSNEIRRRKITTKPKVGPSVEAWHIWHEDPLNRIDLYYTLSLTHGDPDSPVTITNEESELIARSTSFSDFDTYFSPILPGEYQYASSILSSTFDINLDSVLFHPTVVEFKIENEVKIRDRQFNYDIEVKYEARTDRYIAIGVAVGTYVTRGRILPVVRELFRNADKIFGQPGRVPGW